MCPRTIEVSGKGILRVSPDTTRINFSLIAINKDYQEMMKEATIQFEELISIVEKCGFSKDELKTQTFNVQTIYETIETKDGGYEQVFVKYKATHELYLEFAINNQKLSMLLKEITDSSIKPELTILYTIKDIKVVKKNLLYLAIKDATNNALILTDAAEVKLEEVIKINYNEQQVYLSQNSLKVAPTSNYGILDFTPDAITQELEVRMEFRID